MLSNRATLTFKRDTMDNIFKKKQSIEREIDDFLDHFSEAGLLFQAGIDLYLNGKMERFKKTIDDITEVEHAGDALRRSIEEKLYRKTLIPESRGDVLELLESLDALLDRFKGALYRFDIECIEIDPEFHNDFKELVGHVINASEALVQSSRCFFKDISCVANFMHKVSFWETEADKISTILQKKIFKQTKMSLSQKMQLRDFVRHVDKIADRAEDVADDLSIFVIKRSL
jgi:predicted phosphate transport protein (TIGR00153 family)